MGTYFDKDYLTVDAIQSILSDSEIETVSFDIFDTLLCRPSIAPTDIFCLLDNRFPDAPKCFTQLRSTAEARLGKPNVTLSEIWSFIRKENGLSGNLTEQMMQAEMKLERHLLMPRRDIQKIYRAAVAKGKRIIAVSDMYLPSEFLMDVLRQNGYSDVKKVYVSCEYKKRKDDGELYRLVLEQEGLKQYPHRLAHIGDNYHSDFRQALDQGITALYYPSVWDIVLGENSWWRSAFPVPWISENPITRLIYSFSFLLAYHAGYRPSREADFENIENFTRLYLVPLLISTALDLLNHKTIQKEYQTIYFAARDGYLPLLVYQELASRVQAIPGQYLYVSRNALSYGRYKDFFDFFDHFETEVSCSLIDFIEHFILDKALCGKLKEGFSEQEKDCDLLTDTVTARKALYRHRAELNRYFAGQKEMARQYYAAQIQNGKRHLVFDCGYSGSVSVGLMAAQRSGKVDKYYLWQMEENVKRDEQNGTKTFCRFQTGVPFGINLIVEECFSPMQGSHLGFARKRQGIVPVLEDLAPGAEMERCMSAMERIARSDAKAFADAFRGYLNGFAVIGDDVFGCVGNHVFLRSPTGALRLFRDFRFPDIYTKRKDMSLAARIEQFFENFQFYTTSFSGTGFLIKDNYAALPSRKLCAEAGRLRLGIHVHLYNWHLYPEIYQYLIGFPAPFDLYLTVTDKKVVPIARQIFQTKRIPNLRQRKVLLVENRGRDVAPWLVDLAAYQADYDLFCHMHGKESPQNGPSGVRWRKYLFENLLDRQAVIDILNLFAADARLGLVFPEPVEYIANAFTNMRLNLLGTMGETGCVWEILEQMGMKDSVDRSDVLYSVGTMMWYRPQALKPLLDLGLQTEDFPKEPIGIGGTIAHALERIPQFAAKKAGYNVRIFTEYPEKERLWRYRHWRYEEGPVVCAPPANIGLKGALKIFLHRHIPILFKKSAEIHYDNVIGVRGALAEYLSKRIRQFLKV